MKEQREINLYQQHVWVRTRLIYDHLVINISFARSTFCVHRKQILWRMWMIWYNGIGRALVRLADKRDDIWMLSSTLCMMSSLEWDERSYFIEIQTW